MPELPDVEIFKQYLQSTALHKKIDNVQILSRDMLDSTSASTIKRNLEGERLDSAGRHGKYLFIRTTAEKWLVLHFGMTGFLQYYRDETKKPVHTRLLIGFSNGYHLSYVCRRKLGRISLTNSPDKFIDEKRLGPDALDPDLDFSRFREIFMKTGASVKSAIMNQKLLAGIGNIYSDEILFQAGIHPRTRCRRLNRDEMEKAYTEMIYVTKKAIEARADPSRFPPSFITPHRYGDRTCPKCKEWVQKTKIAGRTSYYCPKCQKS